MLGLAFLAAIPLGFKEPVLKVGLGFMSLTSLYAALTALMVLRKNIRLRPSSMAGLRMAACALVLYPTSLLAERLGLDFPFLNPDRTIFEQLYPLFMTLFSILAVPAVFPKRGVVSEIREIDPAALSLSVREKDVIRLLQQGKSLKEAADELGLSVPTIKSHANSAYRKLGVSGKRELTGFQI